MRLLKRASNGELCLTEFVGNDIPRYAILSHTWGPEAEEITFKDVAKDAGKSKAATIGYKKILFCEEQAQRHGITYFWVDTCSIDKSSSAELSEAINSMFRWYGTAVKCFVYLSDVSMHDYESTFSKSRWFKRGWTLQELIAPASVEFFSCEGELLGDKKSLEQRIHEITGIALPALRGDSLSQFTIEERLLWIRHRATKREEDLAYCLLGIFDIFMPLIYGEGMERAFLRLRQLIYEPSRGMLRALQFENCFDSRNSTNIF
jgi:Heterokaryon incompatibility protein (HET)